jgi:NAD-dependent dihydropyrimidine dehydrogenase PreA subunit
MYPSIKSDLCDGCGTCVEICPYEVYKRANGSVEIAFPEECVECGACVDQCPEDCVNLVEG